ncbi:DNA-binding transcriptional regulator, AcrR family [Pedococcus dokdonensis]|uniref:DNA-binding transcriptional regulator, AcrR family n=1 Tax=Pedococcus dokdonensis TaxID=443156 RepID=A0A1H0UX78_9MICO|nr:TetR family transcriptional regulator [Pedococcus dokdonensis]SDP70703.1 DNA-binding transcriptional regulator, AcrR family [Pedococcus dokdonensis]
MSPRGRRPGGADTRQAIVEAARVDFAEQGYDGTSLRGIARRAEVDPALVHHYFGGKPQLFAAVMDIPVDPSALIGAVLAGPRDRIGEALVRTFLRVWDDEAGRQRFQALVRAAVTHEEATRMLREFLVREVFGRVVRELATEGPEEPSGADQPALEVRAGLAASQMIGLAMMRYIVEFPAVVEATHDELAALVGPTLQRYLVG